MISRKIFDETRFIGIQFHLYLLLDLLTVKKIEILPLNYIISLILWTR